MKKSQIKNNYYQLLKIDEKNAIEYFKKSIVKTEQQKKLEKILIPSSSKLKIADIACGGGTLTFHTKKFFPNSDFSLLDFNEEALKEAKNINPEKNFKFFNKDIFKSNLKSDYFDYVFCWQTLGWIEANHAKNLIDELIRIIKPGGKIYISSLFNLDFDVDIFAKILDHTRSSAKTGLMANYNTYSKLTISKWLNDKVNSFEILPFNPKVDFLKTNNRGMATFTKKTESERLQISGGLLMNWGILIIEK